MAIGIAIGTAFGAPMGKLALGVAVGVAIGLLLGAFGDRPADQACCRRKERTDSKFSQKQS